MFANVVVNQQCMRQMTDHWNFGDGLAIRYGGYKDIEWFHGDEFRQQGGNVLIPPAHPASYTQNVWK